MGFWSFGYLGMHSENKLLLDWIIQMITEILHFTF